MSTLKYFIGFIILCPFITLQGQTSNAYSCDTILYSLIEPNLYGDLYQNPNEGIGSQFLFNDWLKGDIFMTHGIVIRNKDIKYNGYNDNLLWLTPLSSQQILLDKELIEGFCIYTSVQKKLYFEKIPVKEELSVDSIPTFAEVLYTGKLSLFAYRKIINAGYEKTATGSGTHLKYIYRPETVYFFRFKNGKTVGFKKYRRHDMLALFPNQKELIVSRLKTKKTRHIRTEDDLINATKVLEDIL